MMLLKMDCLEESVVMLVMAISTVGYLRLNTEDSANNQ